MGKKINKDIIDRVIEAADIVDVIGQFVELKDKGARYIGLCPFHDDKHATNFSVYPAKQCYTCFACGAKGDVVKFVREHLKLDFPDAIRWLGNRYGIPVDDVPVDYVPPPPKPKPKPKPTLFLYRRCRVCRRVHSCSICQVFPLPLSVYATLRL